ncbi:MAG: FkbM family methyltransferase [Patescibacteria group bacterium]|nr:FkbM family methyltransferase [Patescibacteria group bacterium]
MIDPKAVTTYAQYNEDIILAALLHDVKKGFYVDVGANYPVIDSVTKHFYEKGWRGVNIEPIKNLYQQLADDRPNDINLQCGIGSKAGTVTFREYPKRPGHSTFQPSQKAAHSEAYKDYDVPVVTLKEVFEEHCPKKVHFVKIDVEGYEYQAVAGNDWGKYRPEVICIEANHVSEDWKAILTKHGYKLFIQDGINEYYVAEESWSRTEGFDERVVLLDYHALKQHQAQSWQADSEQLEILVENNKKMTEQIEQLAQKVARLEPVSLGGQTLPRRLKRAAYGLTIDWLKYRRNKSK